MDLGTSSLGERIYIYIDILGYSLSLLESHSNRSLGELITSLVKQKIWYIYKERVNSRIRMKLALQ